MCKKPEASRRPCAHHTSLSAQVQDWNEIIMFDTQGPLYCACGVQVRTAGPLLDLAACSGRLDAVCAIVQCCECALQALQACGAA